MRSCRKTRYKAKRWNREELKHLDRTVRVSGENRGADNLGTWKRVSRGESVQPHYMLLGVLKTRRENLPLDANIQWSFLCLKSSFCVIV